MSRAKDASRGCLPATFVYIRDFLCPLHKPLEHVGAGIPELSDRCNFRTAIIARETGFSLRSQRSMRWSAEMKVRKVIE
jgi:hypothetical protein